MKLPSGVPGFDLLVQGGFPRGTSIVVQGPSSDEKNAFLLQFVVEGLRRGGCALVVLASVSPSKYQEALQEAGVDVAHAIAGNRLKFVDWFTYRERTVQDVEQDGPVYRASIDLANVGIAISRAVLSLSKEGERRAAIEVLSPALNAYDLSMVYSFAQSTKAKLERSAFTSLFVLEKEMHNERAVSSIHQPFDGVVDIERTREGDRLIRKIAVLSMKGTPAESKYVPAEVGEDRVLRVFADPSRQLTLLHQAEQIRLNPNEPKLWLATARNLHAMGDLEQALRCVEGSLKIYEHDSEAWSLKAEILEKLGRHVEAEDARARGTPPPATPTKKLDHAARLLAFAEQRLRKNPLDADALFVTASARAKAKDLAGAVAILEKLAQVDETYPGLWVLKTMLHAKLGQLEKAQESRKRRLEVEGKLDLADQARRSPMPLEPEPSRFCASCRFAVLDEETVCPRCGAPIRGPRDLPPPPIEPPKPSPIRPKPSLPLRSERATRGLTNGLGKEPSRTTGRTNGLVNGTRTKGMTNGLAGGTRTTGKTNGLAGGMTNGLASGLHSLRTGMTNGLTNGSGFTNGLGSARHRRETVGRRWKLFLIPVISAALLVTPLLGPGDGGRLPITIDGEFADWSGVPLLASAPAPPVPSNIDLVRVGVTDNVVSLAFYFEVAGTALAGGGSPPIMDTFRAFLDTDKDADTGYMVAGLGADRLVEVSGSGGHVQNARLSEWEPSGDPMDWRGWTKTRFLSAAAGGSRVESHVDWLALGSEKAEMDIAFHAMAFDGATDIAEDVASTTAGSLRIVETPVVPETVSGTMIPLVRFELAAGVRDVTYDALTITLTGTATVGVISTLHLTDEIGADLGSRLALSRNVTFDWQTPRTLVAGATEVLMVAADVTGSTGDTLGATIESPREVSAGSAAVSIVRVPGSRAVGYVGTMPTQDVIDGGFAEWTATLADPPGDAGKAEVDLTGFDARFSGGASYFYAAVDGRILSGAWVPEGNRAVFIGGQPVDSDRDTVPDAQDTYPLDFNNDLVPDAESGGDLDADTVLDYGQAGGTDWWLNTTIPGTFPAPYADRPVSVYIGPWDPPFQTRDDVLRVFVDLDDATCLGYALAGLCADRLVEISGTEGRVRTADFFTFGGSYPGEWSWIPLAPASVATGFDRLEFSVNENLSASGVRMFVEAQAPLGANDAMDGTRGTRGTRTGSSESSSPMTSFEVAPSPIMETWRAVEPPGTRATTLIDANSLSISTQYNHQRKVVRAGDVAGDGACDATNSDGCWYSVFSDQTSEVTSTTAPSMHTLTKGTLQSGTFPGDVSTSNNAYVQYREADQGGAGTADHDFVEQTTRQTTTSSSYVDITGASIASSEFTASQKYLLVITAQVDSASSTNHASIQTLHGSTAFPGSEFAFTATFGNGATVARHTYYWFVVWTAVSSEAVKLQFKSETSGTTIGADQITMFKLHLGDLTENTDWFYDEDTTGDTLAGTTWDTLATVTFTPSAASSWLVVASARIDPESTTINYESRIGRSGEASDTEPLQTWDGNDASLDRYVQTLGRVYSLGAASNTFSQQSRCDASCSAPRSYSNVFALNLDKFVDRTSAWTVGTIAPSQTDFATNIQTASVTPSSVGDFWILGQAAFSNGLSDEWHKMRLQVDNADQPGTQTSDTYRHGGYWSSADDIVTAIQTVESLSVASHTFDVDASVQANPVLTAEDRVVFAVSMALDAVPDYEMEIRHDWSGVPSGASSYELRVEAHHTAGEDFLVQVLTPPATWNTRITITKTADDNTDQTYTLTTTEYNSGAPAVRYLGNTESGDSAQSDLWIDRVVVTGTSLWDRVVARRSLDTSGSTWGSPVILASAEPPSIVTDTGAFNIGTGAAGTTVPVTGVGFQPKVVLFWWSGRTESTDTAATATHTRGFGVAVTTTDRRAICSISPDNAAASDNEAAHRADAAICSVTSSAAFDAFADLSSMDADGFTMIIDDDFPANLRIHYLALGGSSLTNAATGMFTESPTTGNQDIATVGFQPDAVILFSAMMDTDPPTTRTDSRMMVGIAAGAGNPSDVVWAGDGNSASDPTQTISYHLAGESIALMSDGATSVTARAQVDQWLSNGFSLNWNTATTDGRRIHYLALKGGSYAVGDLLTSTTSGTIAETGVGFSPKGALFLSHNKAQSTAGSTPQNHDEMSIGAFSSATDRGAQCVIDEHNQATTDVGTAVEHDEVYCNLDTNMAIEGKMDVQSVDADGFTLFMDDADPVAAFVGYWAIGTSTTPMYAYDSAEPSIAIDSAGYLHVVWASASLTGDQSTLDRIRYTKTKVAYPTQSEFAAAGSWEAVTSVDDAYDTKVGAFNIGTGAAGTTVPVTVGFQPKAVLFWSSGRTTSTDSAGTANHQRGFGVAVSTTDRRAICSQSQDIQAAAVADRAHQADAAICSMTTGGAIDGLADLSSLDANGFTLIIDDVFLTDLRIHYLALGGSSLTNAATGMFTGSATTGNQDITTVGFQPDAVILFSSRFNVDPPSTNTDSFMMIGLAAGAGNPSDTVWMGASDDTLVTTNTITYHRAGESIAFTGTGLATINDRAEVDAWLANGFSLDWAEASGADSRFHFLAMKGGSYAVGDLLTSTTSGAITEGGLGFAPKASLFLSHNKAQSSVDTIQDHDELSIGAFSSAADRGSQCVIDEDNLADSDVGTAVEHNEVYCNLDANTAVEGVMGVQSFDSGGFTLFMDDPDPAASFVGYMAFGAPTTSTGYMPTISTDTNNNPHIAWSGSKTSGTTYYKNKADSVDALIGYRSNTGTNTVNSPKTRTWDGSAWGSESEESTAGSPLRSVRMAWSPTAPDTRIVVTQSDDGNLDAYVCTPTCTVTNNIGNVWSTAPTTPEQRFDIAYEGTSGDALLVYGVLSTDTTRDIAYKTYVGGAWSSEQYLDDAGHATDVQYTFINLASKEGSDRIGLVGGDTTNSDVNAWIWDGSAWGDFVEITAAARTPDYHQAAIAWESNSGDLLAVTVPNGNADSLTAKEFTTGWSAPIADFQCATSTGAIRWLSLKPNPLSTADDMVVATGSTLGPDVNTCYWTGSAWANFNTHDGAVDDSNTRVFDFAWEDSGSKGLLVYGTTAGQITRRTFTGPNTWGTATDVTMGSNAHRWVQLRTNPRPGSVKILGAVMESSVLDLGAIKWDGTTFTVVGASTFSADVGTTSYESFEIEYQTRPWRSTVSWGTTYTGLSVDVSPQNNYVSLASATGAWYDSGWAYRKKITIDYTKVGATLTDFPVLISRTDTNLQASAQSDGDDILFTSSDGTTKLSHEIETYTSGTGELIAFVKTPSVSSSSDTVLYMYYGNAAAPNQQDAANVWDSSFEGVWHLEEDVTDEQSSGTHDDSTANNYDGTQNGNVEIAGQMANGQDFDGSNDNVDLGTQIRNVLSVANDWSVALWFNTDSIVNNKAMIASTVNTNDRMLIQFRSTNAISTGYWDGAAHCQQFSFTDTADWHHLVMTKEGSTVRAYLDGVEKSGACGFSSAGTAATKLGSLTDGTNFFDGAIDETRVSSVVRSAEWIQTEYNNQNSPSTFYSVGGEETPFEVHYVVCRNLSSSRCDAASEFTKWDGSAGFDTVASGQSSFSQGLADGLSVAIGTTETTLGSMATAFPAGDNYVIATATISTIPQGTSSNVDVAAGNLKLKRGSTTLASNQFRCRAGGTTPSDTVFPTNHCVLLAKDAGAPANPTYDVTALASATGMNGEVKIVAFRRITATFQDGGSVVLSGDTTVLSHATTLAAGNNLVIAAFQVENTGWNHWFDPGNVKIKRGGTTLASNQFEIDIQSEDGSASKLSTAYILMARDVGAPANPTYDMTALPDSTSALNGEVKVFVVQEDATVKHALTDSGSVEIGSAETTIGTVSTTFEAGDNVVIASHHYRNEAGAQRNVVAGNDRIRQGGSTRSTNQFDVRLADWATTNGGIGNPALLWSHAGAGSRPSYDSTALVNDATGVFNGETKLAVIHVKDADPRYPSLATTYESNGDLWVAYDKDVDATTRAVYARFLDYPSGGWQTATTVDTESGTIFTRPSIGIDKDNNVHALYVKTSGPQLYYSKYTGSWGTRTAVGTSSDNPTLMVRGPTTYAADVGGLFWKSSASETYFFYEAAAIPEFQAVALPILGILLLSLWRQRRRQRRRVDNAGPGAPQDHESDARRILPLEGPS